jgi:hypothetical protein
MLSTRTNTPKDLSGAKVAHDLTCGHVVEQVSTTVSVDKFITTVVNNGEMEMEASTIDIDFSSRNKLSDDATSITQNSKEQN